MRIIVVSNRAPISIIKESNGQYRYENSAGGLASGMRAYIEKLKETGSRTEIIWVGWPGAAVEDEQKVKREILKKFKTDSVFLSAELMEKFYEGFCNKTIWPLFHYFPVYTVYEKEFWETYVRVNEIFCAEVLSIAKPDDVIWIHDYHLMLLPAMIRDKMPWAKIGFFLHIPFPAYEVFRLLPNEWRKEILKGLYGSDLIGFHTFDYRTYFLHSTLRILGLPNHMGEVLYNSRMVKADTFPMGIDYDKYHDAALSPEIEAEKVKFKKGEDAPKLILSIDRQDYSKGILNRLKGFEHFLQNNPQWKQKVVMMMVVVPSRIGVENYQSIKSQIDELVGRINGASGTMEWMPIIYQYRSLSFNELIALYNCSDVALVTPLRDGMNLVAKEYVAARTDGKGVLILSEMAGAIDELAESITINPNNTEEISNALLHALEMDEQEQRQRIEIMQQRLQSYDVFKWADDFLTTLDTLQQKQERLSAKILNAAVREKIIRDFQKAETRVLFLDYDGTLVPFAHHPSKASPGKALLQALENLSHFKNTHIILVSGRDKQTLENWFGRLPVSLTAEHGMMLKERGKKWQMLKPVRKSWKKRIIPIMERYAEKLPGSFLEEKEASVAFHYRRSDPAFADLRVKELMDYLVNFTSNMDVQLVNGNKTLEMRNAGVDKGVAALQWLSKTNQQSRFVLSVGDDATDEDLFRVMPKGAYSIKVGFAPSYAMFNLATTHDVLNLLHELGNAVVPNELEHLKIVR